jgi:hypothetical protein
MAQIYQYQGWCDWCGKDMNGSAVFIKGKAFHIWTVQDHFAPCYEEYIKSVKALKS